MRERTKGRDGRRRIAQRVLLSACVTGGGAALAVSVPSFGLGPVTVPSTPTVSVPTVPTIPKAPSLPVPSPLPGGGDSGSGDSTSGGGSGSGGSGGSSGGSTGSSGGGGATAPPRPGGASGTRPGATTGPAGNGRQGNSGRPRRAGKRRRSHARSAPGIGTTRRADGRPTPNAPGYTAAPAAGLPSLGLAPQGIPNLFIDRFRIPPFLLPIYQAAGTEYGIPWQVLAAINEIETDYGRNLNISSAGAVGWMQFLPSTFRAYGVDANGDRRKDPFNPVDAIFSAARYLKAAGGDKNLRKGIFAYNHADWYVNSVLLRAKLIGGLPADLVGSLTGLTQARFPVAARASYASEIDLRQSRRRGRGDNPATLVEASRARKEIRIFARRGAAVVATQDARVVRIGRSPRLGRFVLIEDVYGNRYAYGHLGSVARSHFVPRPKPTSPAAIRRELRLPKGDPKPTRAASAGRQGHAEPAKGSGKARRKARGRRGARHHARRPALRKERLFANRAYPPARAAGSRGSAPTPPAVIGRKLLAALGLRRQDVVVRPLRKGSRVVAGTVLGRIGRQADGQAPHVLFRVRPAGRGAPLVDPKPILDGWKLLEQTAVYRVVGRNPFFGSDARYPSIGQILLLGKEALQRRVLSDPRVRIYSCGRRDVRAGAIDRRVLATIEFLAASGLKPTVTSLRCGHGYFTASGNVSHHSSGNAVDVAAINGVPVIGHQGAGSVTDQAVRRLLTLQGTMKPAQIISLMRYPGTDNTYAMGDHDDHIHVGFRPAGGSSSALGKQFDAILKPGQWTDLVARLNSIDNPSVQPGPDRFVLKAGRRGPRGPD